MIRHCEEKKVVSLYTIQAVFSVSKKTDILNKADIGVSGFLLQDIRSILGWGHSHLLCWISPILLDAWISWVVAGICT